MFFNVNLEVDSDSDWCYVSASVMSYGVQVHFPLKKREKVASKLRELADQIDER